VIFVDAPVLGTRQPAEKGQLLVLASGPQEARELCEPLFDAIGTVRSWLGPAGTGSRLKLVVNAWLLAVTDATATSVAISERLGLDPALFFQTIDGGQVDCPYAHTKGEAIMARDFSANFTLEGALKDINLALEASGTEPRLAMLQGVRQDFEKSLGLGHGGEDMAAVYRALVSS
jgi:3-hydroxyisobutyrate dehydrogenase